METNGIDLTKCNNLRYKAKIDGNDDYGRICVENANTGLAFLRSDRNDGYIAIWHCDETSIKGISGREVTDFEIVPRDPETYQDWQVGDIIWDSHESGDSGRIIFRSGDFVAADIEGTCNCYTCGELFDEGYRLSLTDIERQIIEEKKKYEPKDGDVVAWKDEEDDGNPAVSIYKEGNRGYATIFANGLTEYSIYAIFAMNIIRPATDEEKQLLFDAMAKEGKRWNAEKKVVEDIPKPYEFKKGEPVLARDYDNELWALYAYHEQAGDKHVVKKCFQTVLQSQCIPYNERTMHLLGTFEDYKWEE